MQMTTIKSRNDPSNSGGADNGFGDTDTGNEDATRFLGQQEG